MNGMDEARAQARREAERQYRASKVIGRQTDSVARKILEETSALLDSMAGIKREVHVIPVPYHWSPEVAWESIQRGDELPEGPGTTWVNILARDGKFMEVIGA